MIDLESLPLMTTVAGSYPTSGLPPRRAIQRAVMDQLAAGIDLISDGQVRGDMISLFAEPIPGLRRANDGVWEVHDALDMPAISVTTGDFLFARELAGDHAEVKGIVTGPITLALACRVLDSAPYAGSSDPALILRLAEILGHEVAALVASGARVVQVDEPALAGALGKRVSPELAHDALRDLAALPRLPLLHACGDIRAIAEELLILPFEALSIENTHIANLAALDPDQIEIAETRLCVGCVDTKSAEVESQAVVRERVEAALHVCPDSARLWVAPDCGLRQLPPESAKEKLVHLAGAVQDVRAAL
jgi:5-methyltetrahydropteroyltriglutamate--homocysteine methyltransferase